jgi:hypothetical protein
MMIPGSRLTASNSREIHGALFSTVNLFNLFLFFLLFRHLTGVSESGGNAEPGQNPRLEGIPASDDEKKNQQ